MNEEKIKVVYFDGEPFVYRDGNRLNEKEIVELLVEYFKDCDALIKENEQLKQQFNYIQNSISEHIKHQKTELGQKALQEIIEDYNEWLLGHKEMKE